MTILKLKSKKQSLEVKRDILINSQAYGIDLNNEINQINIDISNIEKSICNQWINSLNTKQQYNMYLNCKFNPGELQLFADMLTVNKDTLKHCLFIAYREISDQYNS